MKKQQQGFVSIIMALVIMAIVSLIALGFAYLARQNQEETQNRQLSTQAFYAAESGVNDAVAYVQRSLKTGPAFAPPPNITNCSDTINIAPTSSVGSNNPNVKYTCVLLDSKPTSLEYTVTKDTSRIVRVQADGSSNLNTITIGWENTSRSPVFATNTQNQLPEGSTGTGGNNLSAATSTGILRATVIPLRGTITRSDLITRSQTLFLYPLGSSTVTPTSQPYLGSTSYSDPNQGTFVPGHCNASAAQTNPKFCNITITGLSSLGTNTIYLRLRSIYQDSNVTISATNTSNNQVSLVNEQAKIDATGKANNVLRRIQVRVPLRVTSTYPEFAIETVDSLCKRLVLWPNGGRVDSPVSGGGGTPAACVP